MLKPLIFCLFLVDVSAAEVSQLELRACYQVRHPLLEAGSSETKLQELTQWLYLRNIGPTEIRVPTEPILRMQFPSKDNTKRFETHLIWDFPENPLSIHGVLPDSRIGVVNLLPGETAIIVVRDQIDERDSKIFSVSYAVNEEFAKKYRLWAGKITALSQSH